eukprot:Gregarina_sp_Pseudo_9__753@NODE_1483_length_1556_cov_100_432432_g1373_i0_p1_GENE_NODE_1483_length_1556_cov_100_432432_g1373_i0NODE_1483_length_1556_cov_100_432432_g1373_i0_p1_ORF_typecomplete_len499_score51_76GSH_synth_ATP/PF03917_17/2_3e99GSH_synthase/PF03199_15/3_6e03GSH_synthase/PF03199_15/4_2e14VWA/PF00092_28/0_68_NODE_1483_length_1556_cov_100_432432_g1373_i0441540
MRKDAHPQFLHELAGYKPFKAFFDENEEVLNFVAAPATLYPTPFPRKVFELAVSLAQPFNELCNSMVVNTDWLLKSYERIKEVDDFVKHFVDITENVYIRGPKNIRTCLKAYVARADYLPYFDSQSKNVRLGQVEINLSSVVGPDVVEDLADFHRDMITHFSFDKDSYAHHVPENRTRTQYGKFMSLIPAVYNRRFGLRGDRQVILFVMGNTESNWTEIYSEVREIRKHGIHTYCLTFDELVRLFDANLAEVKQAENEQEFRFFVRASGLCPNAPADCTFEVSCLYWRTAYRPEQYPTARHWEVREQLELAEAVVIPSAISQLAGLKKVQQLWCNDADLDVLVESDWTKSLLKVCFVDQVDPSAYKTDPQTKSIVDEALKHPDRFVLKPQREGGANNYYNDDIVPLLQRELTLETSSYILMRRIAALTNPAEFVRDNRLHRVERCVSELGIYGAALWNGSKCEYNECLGHLLRTKPENLDEGGVSINVAVFDSPCLVD